MARRTGKLAKLEEAVNNQAQSLDPAQREFVLAEFETFKWNAHKIDEIQERIDADECYDDKGKNLESALIKERHQIVTEQASLFSHIMRWLKGTAVEESEIEAFLNA